MRVKIDRLLYYLMRATWVFVGISIGVVAVILFNSAAETLLSASLLWGIALGVGMCVLATFIVIMLRPKEMDAPPPVQEINTAQAQALVEKVAAKLDLDPSDSTQLVELGRRQAKGLLSLGLRLWSGAAALAAAAAIAGSVIAMVTAFAAIRQVSRIDAQNELLEAQIFEAQASRAASVFTAQLPSLLAAIDAERAVATARLTELRGTVADLDREIAEAFLLDWPDDQIAGLQTDRSTAEGILNDVIRGFEDADPDLWVPSDALRARIQAVIDTSEPYLRIPRVDRAVDALNAVSEAQNATLQGEMTDAMFRLQRDELGWLEPLPRMRFSPQRSQLLRLLIAAKVDLSRVDPPFDFSQSDLSGFQDSLTSNPADAGGLLRTDFGRTILARSSFLGSSISASDISEVDLRGSVIANLRQFQFAQIERRGEPLDFQLDADASKFMFGTSFVDVLIIDDPVAESFERNGGLGNVMTLEDGTTFQIGDAKELESSLSPADHVFVRLAGSRLMGLHSIAAKAQLGDLPVYRLGRHDFLSTAWVVAQQASSGSLTSVLISETNDSSGNRDIGDCDGMQPFARSLMQDVVWYADQPGAHPKWGNIVELVLGKMPQADAQCFTEFDAADRQPPSFDDDTFFKDLE